MCHDNSTTNIEISIIIVFHKPQKHDWMQLKDQETDMQHMVI